MKNDKRDSEQFDGSENASTNKTQNDASNMDQEMDWLFTDEDVTPQEPKLWPIIRLEQTVPDFSFTTGEEMPFIERTGAGVLLKDSNGKVTGFLVLWEELLGYENLLKWVCFLSDQDWSGKETIRDLIQAGVEYDNYCSQNRYY